MGGIFSALPNAYNPVANIRKTTHTHYPKKPAYRPSEWERPHITDESQYLHDGFLSWMLLVGSVGNSIIIQMIKLSVEIAGERQYPSLEFFYYPSYEEKRRNFQSRKKKEEEVRRSSGRMHVRRFRTLRKAWS